MSRWPRKLKWPRTKEFKTLSANTATSTLGRPSRHLISRFQGERKQPNPTQRSSVLWKVLLKRWFNRLLSSQHLPLKISSNKANKTSKARPSLKKSTWLGTGFYSCAIDSGPMLQVLPMFNTMNSWSPPSFDRWSLSSTQATSWSAKTPSSALSASTRPSEKNSCHRDNPCNRVKCFRTSRMLRKRHATTLRWW